MELEEFVALSKGNYLARVLADSVSPDGVRLTTVEATFPRPYLAEMNTHRVFSRNSASSRAIPTEKNIERVRNDPYIPETFHARVKGMGVGDELDDVLQEMARKAWRAAVDAACFYASKLNRIGIDKSRANRLLEPFMWHTAIITSTEWSNFFALRCPQGDAPDIEFPAQLEFQQIAILMRDAMRQSEPVELDRDMWHLPLITAEELGNLCDVRRIGSESHIQETEYHWCMVSSRRLARVSFDKHTDDEPYTLSITKAGELASGGHFSPMEHVAKPIHQSDIQNELLRGKLMVPASLAWDLANRGDKDPREIGIPASKIWCGNLRGWVQFRKMFMEEADHAMLLDYEVM